MTQAKSLKQRELEALRHIRNRIMHRGTAPSIRELMVEMGYKSPRSVALIIEELVEKRWLEKRQGGEIHLVKTPESGTFNATTVDVPLVGIIACGAPIFAHENIEAYIPVSVTLARPGSKYFLLRATGDSMNEAGIDDGDLILVRQQTTAEDGDLVVALIDDEATVKEVRRGKGAVVLKPRSSNKRHQPIIVNGDFQVQGVVVATLPNFGE